ncbi:MAG: hypothetical protein R3D68_07400 [Hyphomicrobiaceae bacterium]
MNVVRTANEVGPQNVNPILWNQSVGYARQICARIFRDGGAPADAVVAFDIAGDTATDWSKAVELIAHALSTTPMKRAA